MKFSFVKFIALTVLLASSAPSFAQNASRDPKLDPEMVLATLNGKEFKLKDAAAMIQALGPQLAQVPVDKILPIIRDAWLQEQIYVTEAKKENLQKSSEYKDALARVKRQILIEVYMAKLSEKLVTEAKLKEAYDEEVKKKYADAHKEEVKIQHIQVESKAKALEIIALLDNKSIDFDQAVTKFSKNKENNGVLGYVSENTEGLIPKVRDAALSLQKAGDYTKAPVKSSAGWHIFKAVDRRKIEKPKFEELVPVLNRRVMKAELTKNFEKLKKEHKVEEKPLPNLPAPKAQ